ncbi:MAG: DUF2279 domain-containing protein [Flavobacteriales bacterium]
MKRWVLTIGMWCALSNTTVAQDSLRFRNRCTHLALTATAGASLVALQQVWYKPYQNQPFHFYNDGSNWMQMDKVGHAFTSYLLTDRIHRIHSWSSGKHQPWVGAVYAMSYLSALEIMDGFSSGWGFSWNDGLANTMGVAFSLGQEWLWHKQKIVPKFSFSRTPYAALRPEVLGLTYPQQLLKDYNGQTYWLSFPLGDFFSVSNKFNCLCLSIGYGCEAKLVGDVDTWQGYTAFRELVFSLDIDLRKLAPHKPRLHHVLCALNCIKIPFPSVVLSKEHRPFRWVYF